MAHHASRLEFDHLCGRHHVAFFNASELVESGETEKLFEHPKKRDHGARPEHGIQLVSHLHNDTIMAETEDFSVRVHDYNLWYGDFQALHEVNVDIRPGIVTSRIGPLGCGTTMLLRSLNRINEGYGSVKATGEIKVLGKNFVDEDFSPATLISGDVEKECGHGL